MAVDLDDFINNSTKSGGGSATPITTPASKPNDLDAIIDSQISKPTPTPTTAPTPTNTQPVDNASKYDGWDVSGVPSGWSSPNGSLSSGNPDTITPKLRNALAPDPNLEYSSVIPLAVDKTNGHIKPAMPNGLRNALTGALDLVQGPTTGTVTPEATQLLATSALGAKPGSALDFSASFDKPTLTNGLAGELAQNLKDRATNIAQSSNPETITPDMHWNLIRLGKTPEEIDGMSPKDAHEFLTQSSKQLNDVGAQIQKNALSGSATEPAPSKLQMMLQNALSRAGQHHVAGIIGGGLGGYMGGIPAAAAGYVAGNMLEPAITGAAKLGAKGLVGVGKALVDPRTLTSPLNPIYQSEDVNNQR